MRSRNLKPGFFKNYNLAQKDPPWGRILFEGLWCMADRQGKLKDRPEEIRAEVFPFDAGRLPSSMDEMITHLCENPDPFLLRYEVNGHKYIKILNFLDHQNPHPRESKSILPDPVESKTIKGKTRVRKDQGQSKDIPRTGPDNVEVNIESENGKVLENGDSENQRMGNNSPPECYLSKLLFKKIKSRDLKVKEPNWENWDSDMRLLIQKDGRDPEEIETIINWCQGDSFWQDNILSPEKLRKQFTQLKLKMGKEQRQSSIFKPQPGIDAFKERHDREEDEKKES